MMVETPDYRQSPVPVRDDLVAAHRRAWARLAAPGEWWTGAVRLAIAEETRAATDCRLCRDRTEALSPYADVFFEDGNGFAAARDRLKAEVGEEASVDAAATLAIFNAVVRIADSTGIPLEEAKAELSADLRGDLGLDDWSDAEDRIRARVV